MGVVLCVGLLPTTAAAGTWHVRPDGGDATQCNGRTDAPYPGRGTDQACAWSSPMIALPPQGEPRIAGGDTLLIAPGKYQIGAGAPGAEGCSDAAAPQCLMAPIPGGPSADRATRILGAGHQGRCPSPPTLWSSGGISALLRMEGSSNIEIACLELTDHSPCIVNHLHAAKSRGGSVPCSNSTPFGHWGRNGVFARDAGNVLLRDVNIHGFAANGIRAGRLRDWTLQRVRLHANGWAGWDGNLGKDDPKGSGNHGRMRFTGGEISWNGCGERYPGGQVFGCWAQRQGGYGDGLGTAKTGGTWLFEDIHVHHNTSDGLDLLYLDGTGSATLRGVRASANAGNQVKTSGPMTIEDSTLDGTCAFFTGFPGSHLTDGDHCRAMGNTLSVSLTDASLATIRGNTLTGQGDCLLVTVGGGPASKVRVENNEFVGSEDWRAARSRKPEPTCGHYAQDSRATVSFDSNLFWNVKRGQCPPGSLCGSGPRTGKAAPGNRGARPRPPRD